MTHGKQMNALIKQPRYFFIQTIRRLVQLSVIAGLLVLIVISMYAHYRAAMALEDQKGLRGQALKAVDGIAQKQADPQAWLDGFAGTLWSMKVGGLDITDPLAAAETIASSKTLYRPLLLSILIPVVATLLLGRVFCSWICPGYLLFELGEVLRRLLRFAEIKPGTVKFSSANKYLLLGVGLIAAAMTGVPLFATIYPPAVISRLLHGWVFGTAVTGMVLLLGLILLFEVLVSPRWWCRTVCPGGALYGLLGAKRVLKVEVDHSTCTRCGECHPVCPMGLHPVFQSTEIECDNCGVCTRHCSEASLSFRLDLPGRKPKGIAAPAAEKTRLEAAS